ncbi:MAG: helix-turn-helix domain-containing protein [Cytophagales bacterium]|nr:helix-turn-helix domain-containing protein [Cytophagales bacterium]
MSIIGKNIRKIRTVKKLSQAAFAEIFNLARPSVGAYEEERAEPKLETVIQIANYFGISIDSLLTKELTINDLYNFNVHLEEDVKGNEPIEKKAEFGENFIKSVFVPGDKQLEYIVHINNRDFISSLPKVLLPKHHDKNVRAFEMTTDDMHDNFHGLNLGDLVFGKKMNAPYRFSKNDLNIIITRDKIFIRRVKPGKDHLDLIPDNSNFNPIEISKGEVIEAWEVIGYFSRKIEAPTLISERIMHLENLFDQLNDRLLKIEKSS